MDGLRGPAPKFSRNSISRWQYFLIPGRRSREDVRVDIKGAGTPTPFGFPGPQATKPAVGLPVASSMCFPLVPPQEQHFSLCFKS